MNITAYLLASPRSAHATVARVIFERNKARCISEKTIGHYGTEEVTELVYDCPPANVPMVKSELETKAFCVMERPKLVEDKPDAGVQEIPPQTMD